MILSKQTLQTMRSYWLSLLAGAVFLSSCSKKEEAPVEEYEEYAYEVECDFCEISYIDKSNNTKTIKNNRGKWEYRFDSKITFELKLEIKTTLSDRQTIQAYILKDREVVFGDIGYNTAIITYNTQKANGTGSYGARQNNGTESPSNGGGNNGGSTTPTSSVCGAKNKTGGYCKRVVVDGGRCWQHR
ncbi:hypothetical protein [Sphingobacterium paucimobilis]|uniref:Lipoprotein n=1 Tax=Sphingobacterium paucimobilis HER1398 TaxID=1346330 RepID=U2HNZ3_9SPHI|nr:hypothetical protein [Sphingobacterium paucimobilis]ERJ57167.1 hypothetical protein M472_00160 [Sphingobacterium paucimobilis HER1398]